MRTPGSGPRSKEDDLDETLSDYCLSFTLYVTSNETRSFSVWCCEMFGIRETRRREEEKVELAKRRRSERKRVFVLSSGLSTLREEGGVGELQDLSSFTEFESLRSQLASFLKTSQESPGRSQLNPSFPFFPLNQHDLLPFLFALSTSKLRLSMASTATYTLVSLPYPSQQYLAVQTRSNDRSSKFEARAHLSLPSLFLSLLSPCLRT